jgi:hypothetical protein
MKREINPQIIAHKEEFVALLKQKPNQELIDCFNREVGLNVWTSARSAYIWAIREEFERRAIDYSAVGNDKTMSFSNKVVLVGNKLKLFV